MRIPVSHEQGASQGTSLRVSGQKGCLEWPSRKDHHLIVTVQASMKQTNNFIAHYNVKYMELHIIYVFTKKREVNSKNRLILLVKVTIQQTYLPILNYYIVHNLREANSAKSICPLKKSFHKNLMSSQCTVMVWVVKLKE